MKYAFLLVLILSCYLIEAQDNCSSDTLIIREFEGPKPYSNLNLNNEDCQFQFIVVTDRTGSHRPGVFLEGIQKVNLLQPEFVMSVGDLIEGYTEDTSVLNREWAEFDGFIDQLEMPFFYVPGNHDITNDVMEEYYIDRFGKTFYHFVYKDVLFLCLNSEDQKRGSGRGTISDDQYDYIERTLAEHEDVRFTFVFLHQPLWIQNDPKRWPDVETLLANREHMVFAGHYHHYVKRERNNGKYIMLATTGGGSGLRGPQFGEFDHVLWVTMTEKGPVLANLLLKGVYDENVSTEEMETRIRDVFSEQVVQIEPHFAENEFSSGTFRIKLNNTQDFPVSVKLEEGYSWDIWCQLSEHEVDLPPNTTKWIEGALTAKNPTSDMTDLRPSVLKATVHTELGNGNLLDIPIQYRIKPLSKNSIPVSSQAIEVDGNIDEWTSWSQQYITETGNQVFYDLKSDDENVYIAAKVMDETVIVDTSQSVWRQDCIGFQLNVSTSDESAMANWGQYFLRITPATESMKSSIHRPERIPEEWTYICKQNQDHYVFEMAIPQSFLDQNQGGQWESIRLNVYVDDLDDPETSEIPRDWHYPEWRSKENIVGTGLYFRAQ